jgi:DNA-binding CsgD family transcriptional regulator
MENYEIHLPSTEKEIRKLQATWLGLCAYHAVRAEITTASNDSMRITWDVDGTEIFRSEISPPELAEPLARLVDAYSKFAYDACSVPAWREWATVQSEALRELSKLTPQERVDRELEAIRSLAEAEQAHTYAEAILSVVSQVAGEEPLVPVPPLLKEVKQLFGPHMEHYYQELSDESIEETIDLLTWLANDASDDQVRTFVSAKCAFGCLGMAHLVAKLVEVAVAVGADKEASPIELVKKAVANPVTQAILELVCAFQKLDGDMDRAIGVLWDSGVHPLSKKVSWQQIQQRQIRRDRLVVNQAVHDSIFNLLDSLAKYVATTDIATILTKGASGWLLNSIKKSTWYDRIDDRRRQKIVETPTSELQLEEQYGRKSEDEIFSQTELAPRDTAFQRDHDVPPIEELQQERSLTPKEREVLVLRMTIARDEDRVPSFGELAKLMGGTRGTAEKHWDRACKKLTKHTR